MSSSETTTAITIIIASYNRAPILDKSLTNLATLDTDGIELSIVVVDNNSSDSTSEVIASHLDKLPLVHLHEANPGKNNAINKALNECELNDVVLFTDDDISPNANWLKTVAKSIHDYPETSVFGGPVQMIWPASTPEWIKSVEDNVYPQHDRGEQPHLYPEKTTPIGVNFWVRKEIFTKHGFRYDGKIGPTPKIKKRIMGSETSFLLMLKKAGFHIQYIPGDSVGHYVTPDQITRTYVLNRARTHGRFLARIGHPFSKVELYRQNKLFWWIAERASVFSLYAVYYLSYLQPSMERKIKTQIFNTRWIAYHKELLQNANSIYVERYEKQNS